jgi:hypothetical protein
MISRNPFLSAVAAVGMIFSTTVLAQGVEPQGQGETVKPNFSHAIPNIPGKTAWR